MAAQLSKILRTTNCKQPCQYKEYKIAVDPPNEFPEDQYGNETVFGLWPVSENTETQKEVLLCPPKVGKYHVKIDKPKQFPEVLLVDLLGTFRPFFRFVVFLIFSDLFDSPC